MPARKPKTASKKKAAKKKKQLSVEQKMMKGLAHPLRVRCLALLNDKPWSPRGLSDELEEGLSQVSYHVKVLRDFELIELVGEKPVRGAIEHFYRAVHRVIIPESLSASLPASARLEMLGDILKEIEQDVAGALEAGTFFARGDFHATWTPMDLDEKGCKDVAAKFERVLKELLDVQAEVVQRRAAKKGSDESFQISAAILLFGSSRKLDESKKAAFRRRG